MRCDERQYTHRNRESVGVCTRAKPAEGSMQRDACDAGRRGTGVPPVFARVIFPGGAALLSGPNVKSAQEKCRSQALLQQYRRFLRVFGLLIGHSRALGHRRLASSMLLAAVQRRPPVLGLVCYFNEATDDDFGGVVKWVNDETLEFVVQFI